MATAMNITVGPWAGANVLAEAHALREAMLAETEALCEEWLAEADEEAQAILARADAQAAAILAAAIAEAAATATAEAHSTPPQQDEAADPVAVPSEAQAERFPRLRRLLRRR